MLFDNCEHLVNDRAPRLSELLMRCPGVGVLATSRERLGIPSETVWPVTPLPLPTANADVSAALAMPAVELFLQRAAAVRPGLVLDDLTVGPVVGICRRVDGLPLVLELAPSSSASWRPTGCSPVWTTASLSCAAGTAPGPTGSARWGPRSTGACASWLPTSGPPCAASPCSPRTSRSRRRRRPSPTGPWSACTGRMGRLVALPR